jgi:hypothetical protein
MKRILTDDEQNAICPHCMSDDLDPASTRCKHCGGVIGPDPRIRAAIAIIIVALAIGAVVATYRSIQKSNCKAANDISIQMSGPYAEPDDC